MATLMLQSLLDDIEKSKTKMLTHINSKVDPIKASLNKIQTSPNMLGEIVNLMEVRVSTNEDNVENLLQHVKALEGEVANLLEKTDDLENRSRRPNLHVVGIPESAEGNNIIHFMSQLILKLLGWENFPTI